jgi:hypothetical protein
MFTPYCVVILAFIQLKKFKKDIKEIDEAKRKSAA